MEIVNISMDSILPYELNAKEHPEAQVQELIASIQEFGFYNPIHVSPSSRKKGKFELIAGEGRFTAANRLAYTSIPSIVHTHLSDRQVKALRLADNKIQMNSGFNLERLQSSISELVELDYDLELTGFNEQEIEGLLGNLDVLPDTTKKTIAVGAHERKANQEPKNKKRPAREIVYGHRWKTSHFVLEILGDYDPELINSILDFYETRTGESPIEIDI